MSKIIVMLLLILFPAMYAAETAALSFDHNGEAKGIPENSERIKATLNEDGTWSTSMMSTSGGGYQEDCVIKVSQATKEKPVQELIGKACARIRFSLPH